MELNAGALGSGGAMNAEITALKQQVDAMKARLDSTQFQVTPSEGGTVVAPATTSAILIIELAPTADINQLTVRLPNSNTGQRAFVHTTRQIAELNFVSDGTVDNRMVSLSAGDVVDFTKTNSTTWSRGV